MPTLSRFIVLLPILLAVGVSGWAGSDQRGSNRQQASLTSRVPLASFSVGDAGGSSVSSEQLQHKGKWLLIYMNADCRGCDSLLNQVHAKSAPARTRKIVIVVGKIPPSQLQRFAARFGPEWQLASWYADPDQQAFSKLKLSGVPVALGLRDSQVEWSLSGKGPGATYPTSALNTWIK
jgi:hypothetical protein